jgi:hypothetical protein
MSSFIRGSGSYHVGRNSLIHGGAVPSFRTVGDGVRLCHREYLGDVSGSIPFDITAYAINPGNPLCFPWLSSLAGSFEEYRFEGLVFEYRSSSGAIASTAPTLGNVILATQYNVLEPVFTTKQQMDAYEYSTSLVPSATGLHAVECAGALTPVSTLYVRTGAVPAAADARLYDLGIFSIASQGQQGTYQVGELWVSYDIVFRKPLISTLSTSGREPLYAHLQCGYIIPGFGTGSADCSTAAPFSPTMQSF